MQNVQLAAMDGLDTEWRIGKLRLTQPWAYITKLASLYVVDNEQLYSILFLARIVCI